MIKVGFCASYDWEMLKTSLPRVYDHADSIAISLDENQQTWSGVQFDFDQAAFSTWLEQIDTQNKIKIYKDNFYLPELTPLENDSRQRNMMAQVMGPGGWHVQIDSDEYFINFKKFSQFLKDFDSRPELRKKAINVNCYIIPIIKKLPNGYLFVPPNGIRTESFPVATNVPAYIAARRSGHFNYLSNFFVVHETWARSEDALRKKMNSWGHSVDFDKEEYLKKWIDLNEDNYREVINFHPINPDVWVRLQYMEAANMSEFIDKIIPTIKVVSPLKLYLKNSRVISKIVSILG